MLLLHGFLALLLCAGCAAPSGRTAPQRLSAQAKRELLDIVAAGRMETLRKPDFGEYQAELRGFYGSDGHVLAWVQGSQPTAKARAVIKLLQAADDKGLLADDYDGARWPARLASLEFSGRGASETELLRFDLALSICAMRYISDLHLGRINPRLFHDSFDIAPDIRGPSDVLLKRVAPAQDVEAALDPVEPPFPAYRRLVKAVRRYQELARQDDGELLPLPYQGLVRPGHRYPGVPRLTRLLRLLGDLPPSASPDPATYAGPLVKAVKRFQRRHGLSPDGLLGAQTLQGLNTPLRRRLSQLRLSLERWRWLPHRLSHPPIIVNIPEFRLYAGDSRPQRIVVGIAFEHETPVFDSLLTSVVFRPPWNVPMSIQIAELVPLIEQDPSYLARESLEVIDAKGRVVSTGTVSAAHLSRLQAGRLHLRQRPGPDSSLGLVKFLMPNSHSVYLHGTPSQGGFSKSRRDFSHSCIRVEDPGALAAWALRDQPGWTAQRIREAMAGAQTLTVKLAEPIPVLIQYATAVVEHDGEVRFFNDLYNRDEAEEPAFEQRAQVAR
jgi:murein L,D-transpeptidase YcbB/YkuD